MRVVGLLGGGLPRRDWGCTVVVHIYIGRSLGFIVRLVLTTSGRDPNLNKLPSPVVLVVRPRGVVVRCNYACTYVEEGREAERARALRAR